MAHKKTTSHYRLMPKLSHDRLQPFRATHLTGPLVSNLTKVISRKVPCADLRRMFFSQKELDKTGTYRFKKERALTNPKRNSRSGNPACMNFFFDPPLRVFPYSTGNTFDEVIEICTMPETAIVKPKNQISDSSNESVGLHLAGNDDFHREHRWFTKSEQREDTSCFNHDRQFNIQLLYPSRSSLEKIQL